MDHLNILVFGYKRPQKLYDCLRSLKANTLSQQANLTICIDGLPENTTEDDIAAHEKNIIVAKSEKWCCENEVIVNKDNWGIKRQYFSKIEYMLSKAETVVVLEEDAVVGKYFLDYMQNAFARYSCSREIMLICGYVYDIESIPQNNSCYFAKGSGNKAFGISRTFWANVDKQCTGWEKLKNDRKFRRKYNTSGVDVAAILIGELENDRNNSWDSILNWNSFIKNLLILCPDRTLAIDNGWGEDATNCIGENYFDPLIFSEDYKIEKYPLAIEEDLNIKRKIDYYFKYTLRFKFWKERVKAVFR